MVDRLCLFGVDKRLRENPFISNPSSIRIAALHKIAQPVTIQVVALLRFAAAAAAALFAVLAGLVFGGAVVRVFPLFLVVLFLVPAVVPAPFV